MTTQLTLTTNATYLKGVGPKLAERLQKINLLTIQDLLFHLPFRYEDRTRVIPLGAARPGMQIVVEGKIELTEMVYRGRTRFLIRLSDRTGFLTLRFFNVSKYQMQNLERGMLLRCFGEVRFGPNGYEMAHPEYQRIDPENPAILEKNFTPVYPTTEGLHQQTLRKIIRYALTVLPDLDLPEILPETIVQELFPKTFQTDNTLSIKAALLLLHNPPVSLSLNYLLSGKHPCQQRLIFEELLAHYLSLRQLRERAKENNSFLLSSTGKLINPFLKQLPFDLTQAQKKVCREIKNDLMQSHPMLRLVQGDVGSGKTVVAAIAALIAVENNFQVAIMAPTELLAEQHFNNFNQWLSPLNIQLGWLSSQIKGKKREETLSKIKNGESQVVIGTHALFQEQVEFNHLALVIIDEQHRFGVHQRLSLKEKGEKAGVHPHQLIMTATPIPRTLAMSAYADLDHSIIDELPPGRTPVNTVVVSNERRQEIINRIREICQAGQQAYWVCTLIEESEVLQCQAAEKTAELLIEALPEIKIALVHGRMKSKEKEEIMQLFKTGKIDLLVATTVIEVGVDVPNASLMVIENPERLGLAQLHQLRGRVGRGAKASHCALLYQPPLSAIAKDRLTVMRESSDGFIIAQKDLEIRGPGEVLGTKQTGIVEMRIANIVRDQSLLPKVQQVGKLLFEQYPSCVKKLIDRWISNSQKYGQV